MVFRLFLFGLFYLGVLLVPGAGLAYIGYKALKPRLERRRKLALAKERADMARRVLIAPNATYTCPFCFHPTNEDIDGFSVDLGWHHVNCFQKEMQ